MTQNILKGYITTTISLVIYILTSFLIYKGTFDFVWEGIGGYSLGTILLLCPDNIFQLALEAVKGLTNKKEN